MKLKLISILLSIIFIALAIIHILFPNINMDIITVIFIIFAFLPWIFPYIKSLEFPGGIKIELKDTKLATEKILKNLKNAGYTINSFDSTKNINMKADSEKNYESAQIKILRSVASSDPNLALVGFRIEIEKIIRNIAKRYNLDDTKPLKWIINQLENLNVLPKELSSGLIELISLGNRAAHGAEVSKEAAEWVLETGPPVLKILKTL